MDTMDEILMRAAIEVSRDARAHGNHPFGAILVDDKGEILLKAENTVVTEKDVTGHAETNLMRKASKKYDREFLARCTVYTSTSPCAMCTGAMFWGNVRRIVFGLSTERLYAMSSEQNNDALFISCADVIASGRKAIEIVGPMLEDEAEAVHAGFWS